MKLIKHITLAILVATSLISCADEIDNLSPFTEVDPNEFLNTPAQFQNAVDGMYGQFFNYYASPGSGMQGIPDILADNVILAQLGRRSNQVFYNYQYTSATGGAIALYFSEAYEAVNVANIVIDLIDRLPAGETRDNILAQALAGRALAHFDLVRFYGQIPTQSADALNSLGVTYIKVEDGDTEDPFALPERETVASNYEEIVGDLTTAASLIATENGEGRFNRDGIFGMLSRVYLYLGEYQNAIDAANEVSASIATAAELEDVYTDVTNAGVLVEYSVNTSSEAGFANVGVLYSQGSLDPDTGEITNTISEYAVAFDFFNSIDDDDIRKSIIAFDSNNGDALYNGVRKFLGEPGQVNGRLDTKVLRVAEVLLNKAEAQFELGDEGGALMTLDELRNERFTTFIGGETGAALEEAIQFNRRVELALEGHRFFDIKRRGEDLVRSADGDLRDGSGTPPITQLVPADDFRFQMPIPIGETNANPNFAQNPGY